MSSDNSKPKYRIPKSRIIFVYCLCVVGASFAPLDSYFETGGVEPHAWVIGLLTFLIGVTVATIVIVTMLKKGRFAQFELDQED